MENESIFDTQSVTATTMKKNKKIINKLITGKNEIILRKKCKDKKMEENDFFKKLSELPKKKSGRVKISEDNFKILSFNEYDNITEKYNYNVSQLKRMLSHYKLKKGGNKEILVERLYKFLKYSNFVVKIQKVIRGFFIRKYIEAHGEGFKHRDKCVNQCDFVTLEDIKEIPYNQYFSYRDEDECIYGFDICSLYNHIMRGKQVSVNPYNRKPIPRPVILTIRKFLRLSHINKIKVKIIVEDESENLSEQKKFELDSLSLFQTINELGHYSDSKWFTTLSRVQMIRFIRELHEIWTFRANLSVEVKRSIVPPLGNPFTNINLNTIQTNPLNKIRTSTLEIIKTLVKNGINNDSKGLGAYYVLASLTLVNIDAAAAMPWLFEAVAYNTNI